LVHFLPLQTAGVLLISEPTPDLREERFRILRILFQALIIFHLLLGSGQLSFAQDKFYNRDSSRYSYRIGPVLPKIQQDWQFGSLGRPFGVTH